MTTKVKQKSQNTKPFVTGGTGSAYTLTIPRFTAYENDQCFFIKFNVTNTSETPTLNINGLGAVTISGLSISDIDVSTVYLVQYDGTNFKFVGGGGTGGGVKYQTAPTTGNKIVFSVGTGADTIGETSITRDPATNTITFNGTTINYAGVTENYTGNNVTNLADGATITNNLNGDVTNNYGATYTENNNYTDGAVINHAGDVDNVYDATYVENNTYNDGATINNAGDVDVVNNNYTENITGGTVNHTGVTNNYDNTSTTVYEGDVTVNNLNQYLGGGVFIGDGVTTTRGPLTGRVAGSTVILKNITTDTDLVEGVDFTVDAVTGVITFTPVIPNGEVIQGVVRQDGTINNLTVNNLTVTNPVTGGQIDPSITTIKKGVANFVGTNTITVNDVDVTASSVITRTTDTAPAGFIEVVTANGSFTVNSSATETLQFNYVITS